MLKNLISLEHKVGDRVYSFLCSGDSPLSQVKDALVKFMGHVANVEAANEAAQVPTAEQAAPQAPSVEAFPEAPIETPVEISDV